MLTSKIKKRQMMPNRHARLIGHYHDTKEKKRQDKKNMIRKCARFQSYLILCSFKAACQSHKSYLFKLICVVWTHLGRFLIEIIYFFYYNNDMNGTIFTSPYAYCVNSFVFSGVRGESI